MFGSDVAGFCAAEKSLYKHPRMRETLPQLQSKIISTVSESQRVCMCRTHHRALEGISVAAQGGVDDKRVEDPCQVGGAQGEGEGGVREV